MVKQLKNIRAYLEPTASYRSCFYVDVCRLNSRVVGSVVVFEPFRVGEDVAVKC